MNIWHFINVKMFAEWNQYQHKKYYTIVPACQILYICVYMNAASIRSDQPDSESHFWFYTVNRMRVVYNNPSHCQYYTDTANLHLSAVITVTMFMKGKTRAVKHLNMWSVSPFDETTYGTMLCWIRCEEEDFPQYIHKLVYLTMRTCERCLHFSKDMGNNQL